MKIAFLGTVKFSKSALERLITLKADIACVLTKKDNGEHSDYADLKPLCNARNIEYIYIDDINDLSVKRYLREKAVDYLFSFGWSGLLDGEVLRIPPKGVIGYHPALLPKNRGRHPIVWALALGLKETGSTFFFMDEGADSGNILSQEKVPITYSDDAESLYDKVTDIALKQIEDFLPKLENGTYARMRQKKEEATFFRKRNYHDGEIDWKKPSFEIYNLIRALTHPYVGAHFVYKGKEVKVWSAKEIKSERHNGIEYGKIIKFNSDGSFVAKAGKDAICILEYEPRNIEFKEGERIR